MAAGPAPRPGAGPAAGAAWISTLPILISTVGGGGG
jgi:hypothetical protein